MNTHDFELKLDSIIEDSHLVSSGLTRCLQPKIVSVLGDSFKVSVLEPNFPNPSFVAYSIKPFGRFLSNLRVQGREDALRFSEVKVYKYFQAEKVLAFYPFLSGIGGNDFTEDDYAFFKEHTPFLDINLSEMQSDLELWKMRKRVDIIHKTLAHLGQTLHTLKL
jgi:hypothetical protein